MVERGDNGVCGALAGAYLRSEIAPPTVTVHSLDEASWGDGRRVCEILPVSARCGEYLWTDVGSCANIIRGAGVAELVDARDLKSWV